MRESDLDAGANVPGRVLVRTSSIRDAEEGAARLLSPHRLTGADARFNASISGLSLGPVAVYQMNYGTSVTVTGPPLPGYIGVTIPLRGGMRVTHAGRRFDVAAGRSAAVITPHSPMTLEWSTDLELLLMRIDVSALVAFAHCIEPHLACDDVRFEPLLADPSGLAGVLGSARTLQVTARQLGRDLAWPPALASRIREQMMMTLLLAQPNSLRARLTAAQPPVSREAVRAAVDVVEANPTEYLSTARLATAMGVSVRALQAGFRAVLGTTPHAYVLDVRLRRAHNELVSAHPDDGATVTEIARRWGFGNVGRFAEQYRSVYGEKPSETLRRS